jgi:hypothetical protein
VLPLEYRERFMSATSPAPASANRREAPVRAGDDVR